MSYSGFSDWETNKPQNFFDADVNLQRTLQAHSRDYSNRWPEFKEAGKLSATLINLLAMDSNRDENLPVLRRFDSIGDRVEEIIFHPSYHELGKLVWNSSILSILRSTGNQLASGVLAYLIGHNGEAGHLCPVACTAGAIRLIQELGTTEQKHKYLPGLLEPSYERRIHASQFLTEIQGGSDVGANTTQAEPDGGLFRITGQKWFCSVVDARLFVVTARFPGGEKGTRGLGLFLVPRFVNGNLNDFAIRKLKQKLGTRSMATGEIDFLGVRAEQIGPLDQGFNNAVKIVLDTSRLYNAAVACGMMRRAYIEAQTFSQHRIAFGKAIGKYPLVQHKLAQMKVNGCASLASTLRIFEMTDRIDDGNNDPDLSGARRIDVTINKYWTSIRCTQTIHSAIEVLGGNGTIEDFSVLPRLYRDSIVLESWEGSHNVLCSQVLRDFAQRGMHEAWLSEIRKLLSGLTQSSDHVNRAEASTMEVEQEIQALLKMDPELASLEIRRVVDRMCTLHGYVSLLWELDIEVKQFGEAKEKTLISDLYRLYYLERNHETSQILELEQLVSSAL